mmetsp:Transcript_56089/g.156256  ORF Transcript_56089/g.156256 Transcript_56089/m.156256 type:complete len:758 (+) Transcript_56089:88-2361(+)|eukprot:CAMPEP_0117530848 /NCGR_PEP_ID=MMETSP0784-20121206/38555_1 /TAXON_ID=39447 /ORGANISM="" /LENGTH=757 /DNA_ID=CAMNT_0005327205 /DNA_START=47 /DNA_END=2320 /DNA_ORIENTATION=+
MTRITRGALPGVWAKEECQPILQVLDIAELGKGGESKRYKVKLADGDFYSEAVVAQPLSRDIEEGRLVVNSWLKPLLWEIMGVAGKRGSSKQVLAISQGEVGAVLPEQERSDLHMLRQFPERSATSMSQCSQMVGPFRGAMASQSVLSDTVPVAAAPYQAALGQVTPEKRAAASGAPGVLEQTPNPPQRPNPAAMPAQEYANPAFGAPGQGFAGVRAAPAAAPAAAAAFTAPTVPAAGMAPGPAAAPAAPVRPPSLADYFLQPNRSAAASRGGAASSLPVGRADATCLPIRELTPYSPGRWRIKARVTLKESIRRFTNARGEGQLFKVDLVDKDGGEVTATFFGRSVDKYFEMVKAGQVYYFSRGSVKVANKRFDKGDVVITFDDATTVELADEDAAIPGVQYKFVPLMDVSAQEVNTVVDVKGVVVEARDVFTITLKSSQRERAKREVVIWDNSGGPEGSTLEVTVWGDSAHEDFQPGSVIYVRATRVSEWNGVRGVNSSGQYEMNPDHPDAFSLLRAYEAAGRPSRGVSGGGAGRSAGGGGKLETIEETLQADLQLGPPLVPGQRPEAGQPRSVFRHNLIAIMSCVPQDRQPFYLACPELVERAYGTTQGATQGAPDRRTCHRKMMQAEGGNWRCSNGHITPEPVARYMCHRVQVLDHTGSMEIGFFDEVGRQAFGCEADVLFKCWDDPAREGEREELLRRVAWRRMSLRLKSLRETWNDEERIKVTAEDSRPIDYAKEARRMLSEIGTAVAVGA